MNFIISIKTSILMILLISYTKSVRRTVSSRNWPQSDEPQFEVLPAKAVWTCDFTYYDCGIVNDLSVGSYFRVMNDRNRQISGKTSMILVNITEINTYPSGARLITPYFQTKHHLKGCLTIEFLIQGNGMEKVLVYQQDKDNHCIWSLMNDKNKEDKYWQKISLTIDLKDGDPRFFIETHFDNRPPNSGLLAISEIKFFYNSCEKNDANYCGNKESKESTDDPNELP